MVSEVIFSWGCHSCALRDMSPVTPPPLGSPIAQWQSTPTGNLERSWVRVPLGTQKIFLPRSLYKTVILYLSILNKFLVGKC